MRIAEESAVEVQRRVFAVYGQVDVETNVHDVGLYQLFRPRAAGALEAGVFTFDSGAIQVEVAKGRFEDLAFRQPQAARIDAAVEMLLEHARGDSEYLPWGPAPDVSA